MRSERLRPYISFPAFFLMWAKRQRWDAPDFHLVICEWMEKRDRLAVLRVFRGAAKSTICALYQAWKLRGNPAYRFLDRGADDNVAMKLSSDTKNVITRHPLCAGMIRRKVGIEKFNVIGNPDARNASVTAQGILSNITSSRADEIINDDCEVPKNIKTPDARRILRERLSEEVNIIVPDSKILYIGTPHTHDSIYDEKIKDGYEHLTIPLFAKHVRQIGDGKSRRFIFKRGQEDIYVMVGRRLLTPFDYSVSKDYIELKEIPFHDEIVDIYEGCAWPKRFTRDEISLRRSELKTQNFWDSQYDLAAKPIHDIRLNPEHLIVYDDQPITRVANNAVALFVGNTQLTEARACWDAALGSENGDTSAFAVIFGDTTGHLYWQVLDALTGDVYEQCRKIKERVVEYQLPSVTIKTNGIGGFLPNILRREFKASGIDCGVREEIERSNKTERILSAFEVPLSGRFLHAHKDIYSNLSEQMLNWQPMKASQPDDLLDAGSGCILNLPVRIGRIAKEVNIRERSEWRPISADIEVELLFN